MPVAGVKLTTHEVSGLPLSVKATVPDSFTDALLGVTVAVNVTGWFTMDGLTDDISAVALAAGLTVCVTEVCVVVKFGSPEYLATIV
jgi:hypothetical protein